MYMILIVFVFVSELLSQQLKTTKERKNESKKER